MTIQPIIPRIAPMTALQNRWYLGLTAGLGASDHSFQLSVPSTAVPASDAGLWALENVIPPRSLTFARTACRGDATLTEYAAAAEQMTLPQTAFAHDIGDANYAAWTAYLKQHYKHSPPPQQLPGIFQQWATVYAPSVASIGTADLSEMAQFDAAQQALAPYLPPHGEPADFVGGYRDLLALLAASGGAHVSFDSTHASGDVGATWAEGCDAGVPGLWSGACSRSRLSAVFASSQVTVEMTIARCATWVCTPGAWYDSSVLNTAYSSTGSPPWPDRPNPTWDQLFGPSGCLRQLIASSVVVDGISATITSDAGYRAADQQLILANAAQGMWPLYMADGGAASTVVTFDRRGAMRVAVTSAPGNPLILGQNVLPIAQYLGHAGPG